MVKSRRDKLSQCKHRKSLDNGPCVRCEGCRQLLSLGEADEPGADVAAGRLIAFHGGLADDENLYLHDGGAIAITTGGVEKLDGTAGETRLGFDLSDTELVAAIAHSPPREPAIVDATAPGCAREAMTAAGSPLETVMREQIVERLKDTRSGAETMFGRPPWTPPIETPLDLHLGSCDTLTDRAFPCSCKLLREQHSSPAGPPTSENCKLLGAETCTHDHATEAETVQTFGVSVDEELG